MSEFNKASETERLHIKQSNLINILNERFLKKGYKYLSHFITDDMGMDKYDLSICYHNDLNEYLRVYIEVKVRYSNYEDYFLQKDKFDSIEKTAKYIGGKYLILYVNFCLDGTYIWDLRDINKFKLEKRSCRKYTSVKDITYVDKKVYMLPKTEAKYIPYIHNSEEDNYFVRYYGTQLDNRDIEL